MSRYSAVSTAVVLWILMMLQDALAAGGTIFTPGQIIVNYGNTAVVKVWLELWADLLIGSVNYPDESWDVQQGPEFCAGKYP
jgi:hypothetical protein